MLWRGLPLSTSAGPVFSIDSSLRFIHVDELGISLQPENGIFQNVLFLYLNQGAVHTTSGLGNFEFVVRSMIVA